MSMSLEPNTVADVATATMTEVVEAAHDQYDNLVRVMRRNPLQSIAIATGVGFVLALITRYLRV